LASLSNKNNQELFKQQNAQWGNNEKNFELSKMYEFLAGQIDVCKCKDWVRNLGMLMWFGDQSNHSIAEVFKRFMEEFFTEDMKVGPNKTYYDFPMALIGLYSELPQFRPFDNFSPYTYSEDILDVKFLWLINEFLKNNTVIIAKYDNNAMESINGVSQSTKFSYKLMNDFCYQMELLGLWKYAIFAVLITSRDVIREEYKILYIRNILMRNAHNNNANTEKFLIETLGLEKRFLKEAEATYMLYTHNYDKVYKALKEAEIYNSAHIVLIYVIAPRVITNPSENEEKLMKLKDELEFLSRNEKFINNWRSGGRCIYEYLKFLSEARKPLSEPAQIDYAMKLAQNTAESILDFKHREYEGLPVYTHLMIIKMQKNLLKYAADLCSPGIYKRYQDLFERILLKFSNENKDDCNSVILEIIDQCGQVVSF